MDVLSPARKHGVLNADIRHAVRHALVVEELGEDPLRHLVLGPAMSDPTPHGHLPDGTPITDDDLTRWSDEAETGYDIAELRRRRGRPALADQAATVESVRLDPQLKAGLPLRAAHDGVSVSELIRAAPRAYLRAS